MCESIERVARRTYYGTRVEHLLEKAGVALFAADEPISLTGKRVTTILTRRVKQSVAEWYVLEVLEKSWDGLREHTRQGWNVGRPPYGYLAEAIPHPVPAKRAEGKTKTRLVPDPARGPVVTRIFTWRAVEQLGYLAIADRLNADLERYPPPTAPDPARQRGAWSRSSVRDVLCNPKYTGYMVYNRRATKSRSGKVNPPSAWIWSPQPTHEPLVTRDIFDAVSPVAQVRERSRNGSEPNRHPPDPAHLPAAHLHAALLRPVRPVREADGRQDPQEQRARLLLLPASAQPRRSRRPLRRPSGQRLRPRGPSRRGRPRLLRRTDLRTRPPSAPRRRPAHRAATAGSRR
jgi:hypothetical protein